MGERHDPVEAAIERGDATAKLLIGFRDALFEPMGGILLIAGAAGLRASAAGVVEAVIAAHAKRVSETASWGEKAVVVDEVKG